MLNWRGCLAPPVFIWGIYMLEQKKLIEEVKNKSRQDQTIDSVLMYGSFTQNCGDEFSDVEFYVFVADKHFAALDSRAWIENIYPVYNHFYNEHGTEVVIFKNLVRGEFHFMPKSEMPIIDSFTYAGFFPDIEAMLLFDRHGDLREAVQVLADCSVERATLENADTIINNLLNNLLYGINVYKRGELARAFACLYTAQHYLVQAMRLLEGTTDHWLNPLKQLEQEISPADYEILIKCSASLHADDVLRAYEQLLKEAQHFSKALSMRFGASAQQELYEKLSLYLKN